MRDVSRILKLRSRVNKLQKENTELMSLIQRFQVLSVDFQNEIDTNCAKSLSFEQYSTIESQCKLNKSNEESIRSPKGKLRKSLSSGEETSFRLVPRRKTNIPINTNTPSSSSIPTNILKNDESEPIPIQKDSLSSKSVGSLPLHTSHERSVRTNDLFHEKKSSSRRKSRSPTSRASLLIKKSLNLSNSISEEDSDGNQITRLPVPVISTSEFTHSIVIVFRPDCKEERKKFVRFVESYYAMMPISHSFEWYQGLCSVNKHGDGSHYVKGETALCGTWNNNILASEHHDFLPTELLNHHMSYYHTSGEDSIIVSPVTRRRDVNREPTPPIEKCLFDSVLPEELRVYIYSFLDLRSLLQASLVSTEWKRLTNDPTLWRCQHLNRWGAYRTPDNELIKEIGAVDWQDAVKTRYLLDRNWRLGDCYASTLRGHSGWVTSVDLHHNRLVSSSYDGTVRVWNTHTGNSLQTFPSAHQEGLSPVWCVQCKGNTIVSGSSDSLLRQWNMTTGQCVRIFEGHEGGVKCLQFNEENSTLLSGSDDKTVKVFDIRTGECVHSSQYSDSVGNLCFHNNMLLTVIKREGDIYWHDMRTSELVSTLSGHTKAVYCLDFDTKTNMLVSGSRDKNILMWDMNTGECIKTFSGHQHTVMSLQLDGNKLVSGSGDQTIKIWDVKTGKCSNTLPGHTEVVMSVKFDTTKIASGSADKTVVVWDFQRRARGV